MNRLSDLVDGHPWIVWRRINRRDRRPDISYCSLALSKAALLGARAVAPIGRAPLTLHKGFVYTVPVWIYHKARSIS
jgi:hypothetical protein